MSYIKVLILFILPFNTALASEIFSTGFESGETKVGEKLQNGFYWKVSNNTSISTENTKTGSFSLKFRFPAVGSEGNKYSNAAQYFGLGSHYPELWIKYDLYIPSNYYHRREGGPGAYNNKGFFHLWGGSYNAPGAEGPKLGPHFWPTGSDGNSSINMFAKSYTEDKIVLNKNWNCSTCGDGKSSQAILVSDRGHWMTIVIHVKYATSSNNDGIAEIWKTNWQGKTIKLIDIHDGPWYSTMPDSPAPARGFNSGYFLGWANSGFVEETVLYMDNITFSTTPLSNDYVPDNTAAPKPPKISQ